MEEITMAGTDRKQARREEKKRAKKAKDEESSSDDDEVEEEEEEEPVESARVLAKKARGRAAFLTLLRRMLSMIPLMLMLSKQPFVVRPRQMGVNAAKVKPLELAICGLVNWAAESPTVMRNPKLYEYINATSKVMLTPSEYLQAQQSKRAMPKEKTWAGAYKKTEKAFTRTVDKDTALREMIKEPMPNLPLLGAYFIVIGSLLSPLIGMLEYLIAGGCFMILHAGRQTGMEAQPELYVAGAVAVAMVAIGESASAALSKTAPKKKRR